MSCNSCAHRAVCVVGERIGAALDLRPHLFSDSASIYEEVARECREYEASLSSLAKRDLDAVAAMVTAHEQRQAKGGGFARLG